MQLPIRSKILFGINSHAFTYEQLRHLMGPGAIFAGCNIDGFYSLVERPFFGTVKEPIRKYEILEFSHIQLKRKVIDLPVGPALSSGKDIIHTIKLADR